MKSITKHPITQWLLPLCLLTFTFFGCVKEPRPGNGHGGGDDGHGHLKQTKEFASDVVASWVNLQLQMEKSPLPPGTAGQGTDSCQAYCGIALYESVVNGMPAYRSLAGQLAEFCGSLYQELKSVSGKTITKFSIVEHYFMYLCRRRQFPSVVINLTRPIF